ncbi:uncharacterized protein LOC129251336 isoform X2 [Anastrepha obliqua]|uniref:uncharacterized protein LOC129251336 isoform X2 n=1 Tax=Anastrepha obliqua TaxID=95512 RepID=UPI002409BAB1|nr:uncharacterized protein LOC129251336 isoform X2 [Anastrepha obliqua]
MSIKKDTDIVSNKYAYRNTIHESQPISPPYGKNKYLPKLENMWTTTTTSEGTTSIDLDPILSRHMHESYRHFATTAELPLNHISHRTQVDPPNHTDMRLHEHQLTAHHAYPHQNYISQQQHQLYRQQHRYLHTHNHHLLSYAAQQLDVNSSSGGTQTPGIVPFMPSQENFLNNPDKRCFNPLKNALRPKGTQIKYMSEEANTEKNTSSVLGDENTCEQRTECEGEQNNNPILSNDGPKVKG